MTYEQTALTGGHWEVRGLIQRWVPDTAPICDLIACPKCLAKMTERCRGANGRASRAHAVRLVAPLCPCGSPLPAYCRLCERCQIVARRASWVAYNKRRLNAAKTKGAVA